MPVSEQALTAKRVPELDSSGSANYHDENETTGGPVDGSKHETPITTSRRSRGKGQGLWNSAGLIILLATVGLAVAGGLMWLYLVQAGNDAFRDRLAATGADQYAGWLDTRISDLRIQLAAIATAPATLDAVMADDPAALAAAGAEITATTPYAERVEIFPAGTARLDRDARVPISYAALKVIERAETEPFVGPEGVKLNNQSNLYYAAHPILDAGAVAGVAFVALSADFLLEPLKVFDRGAGRVTLRQSFEGLEPLSLLQWGEAPENAPREQRTLAGAPHWQVIFEPGARGGPLLSLADLLMPLAVALGLLLAGVLFAFSGLARRFDHDADALLEQTSDDLSGRRPKPRNYQLASFDELARSMGQLVRPAAAGATPAPTPKPSQEDAVKDLLDDDTPGTSRKPANEARKPADDFLEVRKSAEAENFGIEVTEDDSPVAMGLNLEPEIFRAYDIRGITTENLTEDVVYWIGRAFAAEARECQQSRVAVGRDGRHSSAALRDALCRGLMEGGVDVIDVGQVPTPVLYFATHALDTGTGIMITGSHNPPEYNGLKMVLAGETLAEARIQGLRARIEENRLTEGEGELDSVDIAEQYLDRVVGDVVVAQPLKVVADCGNGVAGALVPELLTALGCEVVPLYCDVDGDFPNHHPDPAEPANLQDLITVVKAENADLGLAFDGDGDRLGVVTAEGDIIWPDKLLMLFAQDIVGRNPGADIIYDVKCSRHLNGLISDLGGRPIMWKTGHSHIKAKIKETGALLAGEFSGHICFGERWYGFDDALYSAARLLEILGATEASAGELFSQFPTTFSTPELKIQTTEQAKFEVIQHLAIDGDFGDGTITTIDGMRVDYPDGWGLIRPSNTSPVLSLRFEADTQEALDRIQGIFQDQLSAVNPDLRFR